MRGATIALAVGLFATACLAQPEESHGNWDPDDPAAETERLEAGTLYNSSLALMSPKHSFLSRVPRLVCRGLVRPTKQPTNQPAERRTLRKRSNA
ncbi:Hypothetical predicted protein [Cloeon dipterum]|uniref:Uncharacterized protein n=1 Tax=Cloeon dipterum TaxID=197152 RepID=A0A8S1CYZ6_9INSE|nr:Hypothetical predicted protein [Cloeon dipterum]